MNVFENLNQFVPVGHDESAETFLIFLRLLPNRVFYSKMVLITPDDRGINVVEYQQQKTLQEYFKWSDVKRIVTEYYNSLKGLDSVEIQKAFGA